MLATAFGKRHLSHVLWFSEFNIQNVCQLCIGRKAFKSDASSTSNNEAAKEFNNQRGMQSSKKNINVDTEERKVLEKRKGKGKFKKYGETNRLSEVDEKKLRVAKIIIASRYEEKQIFGKLVESLKEKKKRLLLQSTKHTNTIEHVYRSDEFQWLLKLPKVNLKKLLPSVRLAQNRPLDSSQERSTGNKDVSEEKNHYAKDKILGSTIDNTDNETDGQNISGKSANFYGQSDESLKHISKHTSSFKETSKDIESSVPSQDETSSNRVSKTSSRQFSLLPDIIVKNLTSFPLFNTGNIMPESEEDKSFFYYPSVTNILRDTMSAEAKLALDVWKENMIKKLGEKEFEVYQKDLLEQGKLLHLCIKNRLENKDFEIPTQIQLPFSSVENILSEMHDVVTLETYVTHPKLRYKGIVDCVASYRGKRCLIDWKKSSKQKSSLRSTFDAPIQVAAYIGAINASSKSTDAIHEGLIVVAYTNGEPGVVHELKEYDLEKYWRMWLKRLQHYHFNLASQKA